MSARRAVIYKLLAAPSVTAYVGSKIWAGRAEQRAARPYILIHMVGVMHRQLLDCDAGYPQNRIRVEAVADTALEAENISKAVFDALKNVTRETIQNPDSPTSFSINASIMACNFEFDDYSDYREAFVDMQDFYVDWRYS
jgi:hypothetical protein